MKKFLSLILALVMACSLIACGGSKEEAPAAKEETKTEAPAAKEEAPEASGPSYDKVTLKVSHHNAVDQPIHKAFEMWAEAVNEKSGGNVTLEIHPAASLYSSGDAQAAVEMGTLDIALGDTSLLSNEMPAYTITALPFLLDSYETAEKILYGEIGAELDAMAEEQLNIVPIGWVWNGFRSMCTTKPITSVADCKDLKLRSPGTDIYLDTFNTLGMSPTVVTWSEVFTAMQSHMVEGMESGLESIYSQGFYTLGNNICLSRHMISIIGPVINADKWHSLSADTQQLLMECWVDSQEYVNETVIAGEAEYEKLLAEAGCNMTEFGDRQELIDLYTPYWTQSAEKGGYTEILDAALEIVNG